MEFTITHLNRNQRLVISEETTVDKKLTLLIIEDNSDNLELLVRMLELSNFAVIPALNAEEALKILNVMVIHLMLIDINLPGQSGIELLSDLRQNPHYKDIPAIAITASTATISRELCFEAGFASYLVKPVARKKITETIIKVHQDTKG